MPASRTPLFDQAIAEHHARQRPGTRTCLETGESFEFTQADLDLYRSLKVCVSRLSPLARFRRIAARVSGFELYKRTIEGKELISMFDEASPAKVIPTSEFYGDVFDGRSYAQTYDLTKPFAEQWKTFSWSVPRPAIIQDTTSQNCPWALYDFGFKNCYFTYAGLEMSDSSYADLCVTCTHVVDVTSCIRSEWCYECVACVECARSAYSERCFASQNLRFCADCRNCEDCFGCINLRNKKFCFLNEQLDEETYKKRVAEIVLRDPQVVAAWRARIRKEVWGAATRRACATYASERSSGDDLVNCRDVDGIDIVDGERVRSSCGLSVAKDCIDLLYGVEAERCTAGMFCVNCYEATACTGIQDCVQVEYSEFLYACEYCFGCIGLQHKKFCIFNTQYTEEEYWSLLDRIKAQLVQEGIYGESPAYDTSLFAYNGSFALAVDPLTEEAAKKLGSRWVHFPETNGARAFRTVTPEVSLIQELGVALPTEHPTVRRLRRMQDLQPLTLVDRSCVKCHTLLRSRHRESSVKEVLCEVCYEQQMIQS